MKILFVCLHNLGRSQIAKAFYNHLTNSNNADSAGLETKMYQERRLCEFGDTNAMKVMREVGLDIGDFPRRQLTQNFAKNFDLIVVMAKDSEIPKWLANSRKMRRWPIEVPHDTKDWAARRPMRDEIEQRVRELICENRENRDEANKI